MSHEKTSPLVVSPCVRNCCLDDEDICLGCFRSIDEITGWSTASDYQRAEMLKQAANRRDLHQKKYQH